MQLQQPLGVILAGGAGRRMGGADKGALVLGGQTLLSRVAERLEPQVAALAVSSNDDVPGMTCLPDPVPGLPGPLAGVLAGMDWAAGQGGDAIVTVPVDTPFFPCDLVPWLVDARRGDAPVICESNGRRHPVCGLWPVALRGALRDALEEGTRKVWEFAQAHAAQVQAFPVDKIDPFFNINTPDDLAQAESWLA